MPANGVYSIITYIKCNFSFFRVWTKMHSCNCVIKMSYVIDVCSWVGNYFVWYSVHFNYQCSFHSFLFAASCYEKEKKCV